MTTAKTTPLIFAFLLSAAPLIAASSMVGDVGTREARVWVGADPAEISAECSEGGKAAVKASAIVRNPQNGGACTAIFSGLKPGAAYEYSVKSADGAEIAKGSFKTKPDHKDRTPPRENSRQRAKRKSGLRHIASGGGVFFIIPRRLFFSFSIRGGSRRGYFGGSALSGEILIATPAGRAFLSKV